MAYVLSVIAAALWQRVTNVPDIKELVIHILHIVQSIRLEVGLL